jgi:hypothetical protein
MLNHCKDLNQAQVWIFRNVSLHSPHHVNDERCLFENYDPICRREFRGELVDVMVLGNRISSVHLIEDSEIDQMIHGFE